MIRNDNFNKTLKDSGLTMYALAKRSGVPYTTINEIHNGKNDINQCAFSTVIRLAGALGVSAGELTNDIYYLNGIKGKYKGTEFTWSTSDESQITFEYMGDKVTLKAGAIYNIPSRLEYYNIIAGWMIKDYISHREWEKSVQELIRSKTNE